MSAASQLRKQCIDVDKAAIGSLDVKTKLNNKS